MGAPAARIPTAAVPELARRARAARRDSCSVRVAEEGLPGISCTGASLSKGRPSALTRHRGRLERAGDVPFPPDGPGHGLGPFPFEAAEPGRAALNSGRRSHPLYAT